MGGSRGDREIEPDTLAAWDASRRRLRAVERRTAIYRLIIGVLWRMTVAVSVAALLVLALYLLDAPAPSVRLTAAMGVLASIAFVVLGTTNDAPRW